MAPRNKTDRDSLRAYSQVREYYQYPINSEEEP
jgi:hypothetical protein